MVLCPRTQRQHYVDSVGLKTKHMELRGKSGRGQIKGGLEGRESGGFDQNTAPAYLKLSDNKKIM